MSVCRGHCILVTKNRFKTPNAGVVSCECTHVMFSWTGPRPLNEVLSKLAVFVWFKNDNIAHHVFICFQHRWLSCDFLFWQCPHWTKKWLLVKSDLITLAAKYVLYVILNLYTLEFPQARSFHYCHKKNPGVFRRFITKKQQHASNTKWVMLSAWRDYTLNDFHRAYPLILNHLALSLNMLN